MNWPKLPNRKSFLEKGYTAIQMREYAEKCVKQAIATEEYSATQEPVAWMTTEVTTGTQVWLYEKTAARYQNPPTPLYTHPQPKREPLTDEQKNNIARRAHKDICKGWPVQERIVRVIDDIEATSGIKGEE